MCIRDNIASSPLRVFGGCFWWKKVFGCKKKKVRRETRLCLKCILHMNIMSINMTLLFFNQILNEKFREMFFSLYEKNRNFVMFVASSTQLPHGCTPYSKIWIFMKNFAHWTRLSKLKSVFSSLTMFRFVLDGFDIAFFSHYLSFFFIKLKHDTAPTSTMTSRFFPSQTNDDDIKISILYALGGFKADVWIQMRQGECARWAFEWMVIKSRQEEGIFMRDFYDGIVDGVCCCADKTDSNFKWIYFNSIIDIFSGQIALSLSLFFSLNSIQKLARSHFRWYMVASEFCWSNDVVALCAFCVVMVPWPRPCMHTASLCVSCSSGGVAWRSFPE